MKKIITLSSLAISLAATTVFGQGWLAVDSGRSQVWDGFTTAATSVRASTVDVGLFWAASGTANPMPLVSTLTTGNSTTSASYTDAQAWADILGNVSWTLGQEADTGNSSLIVLSSSTGVVAYNGSGAFSITGTSGGTSYSLLEVSWNAAYATPTIAGANGSAIGWSYLASSGNLGASSTDTGSPNIVSGFTNYGTFIPNVPEPTTIALAGLGGLSLLLARRKK